MTGFLWETFFVLAAYCLGIATGKNMRRWWVKFANDPRGAVDAEITELQRLRAKL